MLNNFAKVASLVVLAASTGAIANAQTVKSVITLPSLPEGLVANDVTNRIYVALPSFGNVADSIAVIDSKTDTIISTISIPPVAQSIAVDMVRDLIYVGGTYFDVNGVEQSQVAVVNGKSNKVVATIPVTTTEGQGIEGIAVNSFSGEVYVSNASDNVIDVIYPGKTTVAKAIPVAESPYGVITSPFKNQVFVALSNGTVALIDGHKNVITTTTTVGDANAGITANWFTGTAYVTNNDFGPSTVGVVDKTGTVVATVPVGNTPFGIDVDQVTGLVFVANTQDGTVSVIDGKSNTVTATLPVTGLYVAANSLDQKVYVGGQDASITVISEPAPSKK